MIKSKAIEHQISAEVLFFVIGYIFEMKQQQKSSAYIWCLVLDFSPGLVPAIVTLLD